MLTSSLQRLLAEDRASRINVPPKNINGEAFLIHGELENDGELAHQINQGVHSGQQLKFNWRLKSDNSLKSHE